MQVTVQEDFVEGSQMVGHEEGGMMNNFNSMSEHKNFGETFDASEDVEQ